MNFEVKVHGKFIVAGEHSVLRGSPALVFPFFGKSLRLKFEASKRPLEIRSPQEDQVQLITSGLLDKALAQVEHRKDELQGILHLENSIPLGAGLGASAALCVSVSRFLVWKGWLNQERLHEFARELENVFHGESSGVDIAVAISEKPLIFERGGKRESFEPRWMPSWALSYCGSRGMTADAILKVKSRLDSEPELGAQIDSEMKNAVWLALRALSETRDVGVPLLKQSIQKASYCFDAWGLSEGALKIRMNELSSRGALAAKPTGSGAGGFILSLWPETVPPDPDLLKI
jgi:mevalonate kinase